MQDSDRTKRRILIFGAGRIGRGFIAHLAKQSGYAVSFVDANAQLIDALKEAGRYRIFVMGAAEKDDQIEGFEAMTLDDTDRLGEAIATHDLFATAVGGPNLERVGAALADGLARRAARGAPPVDVLLCENYKDPAALLSRAVGEARGAPSSDWLEANLGLVETQILKTVTTPEPERRAGSLDLQVEDAWRLPCDLAAFRGEVPALVGLDPQPDFHAGLLKKVYSYNCTNAVIAYLGFLKGHHWLSEAANDPAIDTVARGVIDETLPALANTFNADPDEQRAFQEAALRKYRDRTIRDPITRNARDTSRKLAAGDRLVGPAQLAIEHGTEPRHLALAIAAALHYADPNDPGTVRIQRMLREHGLNHTLETVCELAADSALAQLVRSRVSDVAAFNVRGVPLIES